jgi:hypothetical protein
MRYPNGSAAAARVLSNMLQNINDAKREDEVFLARQIQQRDGCTWHEALTRATAIIAEGR